MTLKLDSEQCAGLAGGRVPVHCQGRQGHGRSAAGELQLGRRPLDRPGAQPAEKRSWARSTHLAAGSRLPARPLHGAALSCSTRKAGHEMLSLLKWSTTQPAETHLFGLATPIAWLAVAFLHDPCTVRHCLTAGEQNDFIAPLGWAQPAGSVHGHPTLWLAVAFLHTPARCVSQM